MSAMFLILCSIRGTCRHEYLLLSHIKYVFQIGVSPCQKQPSASVAEYTNFCVKCNFWDEVGRQVLTEDDHQRWK